MPERTYNSSVVRDLEGRGAGHAEVPGKSRQAADRGFEGGPSVFRSREEAGVVPEGVQARLGG